MILQLNFNTCREGKSIVYLFHDNKSQIFNIGNQNGLSNKQIADKYNISIRTVHRSLKKIKPDVSLNLDIKNNIYKKFETYSSRS